MDYRIREILIKLESNLSQTLSIKDLADDLNISVSRFQHLFKQETGKNYTKYTKDLRLRKTCELLEKTNLRVKEIRAKVSAWDESSFFREFKREFGTTPTEYRENYHLRQYLPVDSINSK